MEEIIVYIDKMPAIISPFERDRMGGLLCYADSLRLNLRECFYHFYNVHQHLNYWHIENKISRLPAFSTSFSFETQKPI